MLDSITVQTASESANIQTLIFTILLAFVLSTLIAVVYQKTFRGLSYSRNFVQAVILISLIAAVIIQAIGDSLARGLGIMAAMAIIRFRTNLKDPRDTLFLFASLAAGISCGAYAFDVAIVGTVGFSLAVFILYYSPLGSQNSDEGILRFNMSLDIQEKQYLDEFMQKYCSGFTLITIKEPREGGSMDYAYQVKLRPGKSHEEFFSQLKCLPSLTSVSLKVTEATTK